MGGPDRSGRTGIGRRSLLGGPEENAGPTSAVSVVKSPSTRLVPLFITMRQVTTTNETLWIDKTKLVRKETVHDEAERPPSPGRLGIRNDRCK